MRPPTRTAFGPTPLQRHSARGLGADLGKDNILSDEQTGSPRKRGSGLNRSETVTIRLDPKLNYLCELAARVQRRTKSSFIESAVADYIDRLPLSPRNEEGTTIGDMAEQLWHVKEPERLIRLATIAPHLMSYDEQRVWAVICDNGLFWKGYWVDGQDDMQEWYWTTDPKNICRENAASYWGIIVGIASGEIPPEKMPKWKRTQPKPITNLDDEIPF